MPSFDLEVAFREDSVDVADNLLYLGYCFSGATEVGVLLRLLGILRSKAWLAC